MLQPILLLKKSIESDPIDFKLSTHSTAMKAGFDFMNYSVDFITNERQKAE